MREERILTWKLIRNIYLILRIQGSFSSVDQRSKAVVLNVEVAETSVSGKENHPLLNRYSTDKYVEVIKWNQNGN